MNIRWWFPLGLPGLISFQAKGLPRVLASTITQKHQFFCAQPSLRSNSHNHVWLLFSDYQFWHEYVEDIWYINRSEPPSLHIIFLHNYYRAQMCCALKLQKLMGDSSPIWRANKLMMGWQIDFILFAWFYPSLVGARSSSWKIIEITHTEEKCPFQLWISNMGKEWVSIYTFAVYCICWT